LTKLILLSSNVVVSNACMYCLVTIMLLLSNIYMVKMVNIYPLFKCILLRMNKM
jgi:hypothetical protein